MQGLTKLALRVLKIRGGGQMDPQKSNTPEPIDMLKTQLATKMYKKQIKEMEEEDKPQNTEQITQQVLEQAKKGNIDMPSLKDVMNYAATMKMLDSLNFNSGDGKNNNIMEELKRRDEEHKRELEKIKEDMQKHAERADIQRQFSDVLKIVQGDGSKDKTVELVKDLQKSWIDSFTRTQEIDAQSKKEIGEANRRADEERNKRFEDKIESIKSQNSSGGGDELGVKELAKGLFQVTAEKMINQTKAHIESGGEAKKSSMDVAGELIGNVIDKIGPTLLKPLGEGIGQRIAMSGQQQPQYEEPPMPQEPAFAEPQPIHTECAIKENDIIRS